MKKERFSLREMEHIAVNFAITCLNGYTGSFEDYMASCRSDWRKILKKQEVQKSNIEDLHRLSTTPNYLCRPTNISMDSHSGNECNCGQPSCTFGCS